MSDWADAISHLTKADPKLVPLVDKHGHPTIKAGRDPVAPRMHA